MITNETATTIARIYREIQAGEAILESVDKEVDQEKETRGYRGEINYTAKRCRLEWPHGSSEGSYMVYNVEPSIARAVIVAHLADQKAKLEKLNEVARLELSGFYREEGK